MRRSEFFLIKTITSEKNTYLNGTMIHPIFNKLYLSKRLRELLELAIKTNTTWKTEPKAYVMCLVGSEYLPIEKDNIEERY